MTYKVQKIRQEVERIQLYTQSEVLKGVLDYIDKVQEEPVSDELEEAATKYAYDRYDEDCRVYNYVELAFKAGARWQKKRDNIPQELVEAYWEFIKAGGENVRNFINAVNGYNTKKPVSEDFKRFEEEYLEKEKDEILCVYDRHAGLVDGAQWQKQRMMKNVTYGEVSQCTTYPYNLKIQSIKTIDKDLKVGDKVKLIIIKED